MSKQDDINKLDRDIRDAEIRKQTFLTNVSAITKEIATLIEQEAILSDNVACLKKKKVIAVAKEYQKTKEELIRIKGRLADFNNQKENYKRIVNDMQKFIDINRKELDRLQKDNNVLTFRRKDGQG